KGTVLSQDDTVRPGPLVNRAVVTSTTRDPDAGNDSDVVALTLIPNPAPIGPHVLGAMTAVPPDEAFHENDEVTYLVFLSNDSGPHLSHPADQHEFWDPLPEGLTLPDDPERVTATCGTVPCGTVVRNGNSVFWDGDVGSTAIVTLHIRAKVSSVSEE